jgi:Lectin C-type domain
MNTQSAIGKTKALLTLASIVIAAHYQAHAALPVVVDTAVNPANNHTYYLLSNSTWADAQTTAVSLGGNLTTINDLAENNWISDRWGTNRDLWIGLYDPVVGDGNGAAHAANFRWIDGDPSAYRNWRAGEPNNADSDYYTYIWAKNLVSGGVWNDIKDELSTPGEPPFQGVVEVVPEPSTAALLIGTSLGALVIRRGRNARRR